MPRRRGTTAPAPQCPLTLFPHLLQVTHMIDNEATVVFAMFMAIWGRCPCLGAQHVWLGEGAEGGKRNNNTASPFGRGLYLLHFQNLQLPFQTQQETKPPW